MLVRIEKILLGAAGVCVIAMGMLITMTVLLRSLAGWGVPDDVVIVKELMVGAIVLPLAAVSSARAHIAIEFLYKHLPGKTQAWLLAFSSAFALISLVPIAYAAWRELAHVIAIDSYFFGELSLPKWPGRFAFFVGIGFFALRMAVLFFQDLKAALKNASNPASGQILPRK